MEWFLVNMVIFVFRSVLATTPTPGVCQKYSRIKERNYFKIVKIAICCNQYYRSNDGVCIECPIGHHSKGEKCTKCASGLYGHKCSFTCRCNSTERSVLATTPTPGVCQKYSRIKERNYFKIVKIAICCNQYYRSNDGVCIECPIGHHSKGEKCTKCASGLYGHKCSFTCRCNSTERCDHVNGCVLIDARKDTDDTFKNYPSDGQGTAITSREIILLVVIIFIGLLFFFGLMYACRKRQRSILVIPLQNKEIQADTIRHHPIEERSEGVYDEIDESAMSKTVALSPVIPSLHSSYLDVTDSQCYTMDTNDTPKSIAMAMFSTRSEPAKQTGQRRQRCSLQKNIMEQTIQRREGNEYSDGYLRPMFLAEHNWFDKMSENKRTLFSNKEKITEKVYDKPAYDGISISVSYDRLICAKSVGNQIYGGVLVNNQIYPSDDLLDKNLKQSKFTPLASKRKTI